MHRGRLTFGALPGIFIVLACMIMVCVNAVAQQPGTSGASAPGQAGSARGELAVTATVLTSVGLVITPDGEPRMVIANAADPKDNVSRLQPVVMAALMTVTDAKTGKRPKMRKKKH